MRPGALPSGPILLLGRRAAEAQKGGAPVPEVAPAGTSKWPGQSFNQARQGGFPLLFRRLASLTRGSVDGALIILITV